MNLRTFLPLAAVEDSRAPQLGPPAPTMPDGSAPLAYPWRRREARVALSGCVA